MKRAAFVFLFLATPAFANSARTATVADQKRDFSSEISGAINDVERSLAEIKASSVPVSESALYAVHVALQPARERWAAVNAADARHFDRVKDDARTALTTLESSYYVLVSSITSERRAQEQRVTDAVAALGPMAADLRSRAAASRGSVARRLTAAADRLEGDRRSLAKRSAALSTRAGAAWAEERRKIEADLSSARDRYWSASRRSARS